MKPNYLEPWYRALRSSAGVCFRFSGGSLQLTLNKLYKARAESLDPALKTLSLVQSPTAPDEIWIVHREDPNAATSNPLGREEGDDEFPLLELPEDGGTLP